jgi:hypothetical protein
VNETNLVCIHEARIAHHVAAIGQVDREHGAPTILDGACTMIVKFLVVMRLNISTRKHIFNVGEKLGIDGHHVFEVPVGGTILHHPDFAISFNDLGLNLAHFFVEQHRHILGAVDDRLSGFDYAIWTQ